MEMAYDPNNLAKVFSSPFEQYSDRNGQKFDLIEVIEIPDMAHDEEVLPMYRIRFRDDGMEIEAWPEEIFEHI